MVFMKMLIDNADTTAGILTVLALFVVVALPALIGAAHERRIDRQLGLRDQHRDRPLLNALARHLARGGRAERPGRGEVDGSRRDRFEGGARVARLEDDAAVGGL